MVWFPRIFFYFSLALAALYILIQPVIGGWALYSIVRDASHDPHLHGAGTLPIIERFRLFQPYFWLLLFCASITVIGIVLMFGWAFVVRLFAVDLDKDDDLDSQLGERVVKILSEWDSKLSRSSENGLDS